MVLEKFLEKKERKKRNETRNETRERKKKARARERERERERGRRERGSAMVTSSAGGVGGVSGTALGGTNVSTPAGPGGAVAVGAGAGAGADQGPGPATGSLLREPPSKIYLDTYLETVTSLPSEVQRILNTLKDIDKSAQEVERQAQTKTERCLSLPQHSSRNTTDEQKKELATLRKELDKDHDVLQMLANEKIELTKTAYELLGGHMELLDEDLIKFEHEITLNVAEQELQQLQQQQADALADREKAATGPRTSGHHHHHHGHGSGSGRGGGGESDNVRQGDQVAARTSAVGAPDEWILARVMNVSSDGGTYTILDEDADEGGAAQTSSSIHHLPQKQVIRLPKTKEKKHAKTFSEGSYVLAVFPSTTMFYRAFVVQPAKWQAKNSSWGAYTLGFDDDEDPNNPGYSTNRVVPFHHVVPLPRDFKLG